MLFDAFADAIRQPAFSRGPGKEFAIAPDNLFRRISGQITKRLIDRNNWDR
jgi:hypothetical protein